MRMIDQKSRMSRLDTHADISEVMLKLALIFTIFIMLVSAYAVWQTLGDVEPELMVSPDYAGYMQRYNGGMVFNDMTEVE